MYSPCCYLLYPWRQTLPEPQYVTLHKEISDDQIGDHPHLILRHTANIFLWGGALFQTVYDLSPSRDVPVLVMRIENICFYIIPVEFHEHEINSFKSLGWPTQTICRISYSYKKCHTVFDRLNHLTVLHFCFPRERVGLSLTLWYQLIFIFK